MAILSDLFPKDKIQDADYGDLKKSIQIEAG